jgi:hypothetical protein
MYVRSFIFANEKEELKPADWLMGDVATSHRSQSTHLNFDKFWASRPKITLQQNWKHKSAGLIGMTVIFPKYTNQQCILSDKQPHCRVCRSPWKKSNPRSSLHSSDQRDAVECRILHWTLEAKNNFQPNIWKTLALLNYMGHFKIHGTCSHAWQSGKCSPTLTMNFSAIWPIGILWYVFSSAHFPPFQLHVKMEEGT